MHFPLLYFIGLISCLNGVISQHEPDIFHSCTVMRIVSNGGFHRLVEFLNQDLIVTFCFAFGNLIL